jgi:hypothetical protein
VGLEADTNHRPCHCEDRKSFFFSIGSPEKPGHTTRTDKLILQRDAVWHDVEDAMRCVYFYADLFKLASRIVDELVRESS